MTWREAQCSLLSICSLATGKSGWKKAVRRKQTFVCRHGTIQFEVMPFGLMNAPTTFERLVDQLFRGPRSLRVYLDDVVLFSKSLDEHLAHLTEVFRIIRDNRLKLKISRCSFAQSQTRLLGHIVSPQGIKVDPGKFRAVQWQLAPTNTTELRSFLGLAGYFRRFIPGFAEISATWQAVTSVKRTFAWNPEMQKAFEELKQKLTSPPVLAFPNFEKSFVVETDASSVAVGAVLAQRKEDGNFILHSTRVVQ